MSNNIVVVTKSPGESTIVVAPPPNRVITAITPGPAGVAGPQGPAGPNPLANGYLDLPDLSSTPSAPASGVQRIWANSNGAIIQQDPANNLNSIPQVIRHIGEAVRRIVCVVQGTVIRQGHLR